MGVVDQGAAGSVADGLLKRGVMIEPDALELLRASPHLAGHRSVLGADIITASLIRSLVEAEGFVDGAHRVIFDYKERFDQKGTSADFLRHFKSRFDKLAPLLCNKPQIKNLVSINKLSKLQGREHVSLVGLVLSKRQTRNGDLIIELDDPTGSARAFVSKNNPAFRKVDEIVEDELLGVTGQAQKKFIFTDMLFFPEISPAPWKRGKSTGVFISDTHVGSNNFLEDVFLKFVDWINGGDPTAKRVKYVFVAGDLVDGIGVYKGQQKELNIPDVIKQYERFAEFVSLIPKHMTVFVCPGNHDASRLAEPQPKIPAEFASTLYEMKNVVMLSSPAYVCVEGITVLMYHGTSLDGLIDQISSLRKTGYDQPQDAMIHWLKKRHLAPSYGGDNRIFPDREDYLVVDPVPNVIHSGHVHNMGYCDYRGVKLINSGTFQARTAFQLKLGHHPSPGLVPAMDFADGSISVFDFNRPEGEQRVVG